MPSTRQNLISNSPFLSGQREKIGGGMKVKEKIGGGMKVKRSTITADAFKKGTSQETTYNIESRVGNNERKITLLKNIIKLRKENVDNKLEGGGQSVGLKGILDNIASTVDSIRDTLIGQQEFDKDKAEDDRLAAAQGAREKQEKGAEKERFAGIKKIGDKVLAPVKSLWSKIWNFISTIFLGKVLLGILDWFGNKENKGKINSLIGFVKTWWPALVAAVLLFGTGFGGLVATLVGAAIAAVPALIAAGKALAAAIAANPVAAAAAAAALGIGAAVIHGMNKKKKGDDEGDEGDSTNVEATGDNTNEGNQEVQKMNKGGVVPGKGNTDNVPAMLTPGEFVMSKGAVQKYGENTLAAMNAAAGGTNNPKEGKYNTGGMVGDTVTGEDLATVNEERKMFGKKLLGQDPDTPILSQHENSSMNSSVEDGGGISSMKVGDESGENMESSLMKNLEKEKQENKEKEVPIYNRRGRIIGYKKVNEIKLSSNQNTKSAAAISKSSKPKGGTTVVQGGGAPSSSDDTQAQDSGGGKIPMFEPGMMRDASKIKTLGILIL